MRKQMAFGRARGYELNAEWARVPLGSVDILATHTPPLGIMDGDSLGCADLKKALGKIDPAVHVFGHIHACYGTLAKKRTLFINAASAKERRGAGGLVNPPIV